MNIELESLVAWPIGRQLGFIVVVMLAINAPIAWLWHLPQYQQFIAAKKSEQSLILAAEHKQARLLVLARTETSETDAGQLLTPASALSASHFSMAIAELNQSAQRYQLSVEVLELAANPASDGVELRLLGRYHDIRAFCQAVAESSPLLRLDNAEWQRRDDISGQISFSAQALFYQAHATVTAND